MSFSLTILGSNSALPTSDRYPSAQILNVSERFFLIDCGEGTQMQLRRNHVKLTRIHHAFISHLHGDHCFGLIGLISTLGLLGRKLPLTIHAPKPFEQLLTPWLKFFCDKLPFQVCFNMIKGKELTTIFEDDKVMVQSFPLEHRIETFGFLFVEKPSEPNIKKECIKLYKLSIAEIVKIKKGADLKLDDDTIVPNNALIHDQPKPRSFAYCSDTRYMSNLASFIQNVDLLYHEATFLDSEMNLAIKTFHSTAKQAAQVAKDVKANQLIIGHYSSRHKDLNLYLNEAREEFSNTELALEGVTFEVERKV